MLVDVFKMRHIEIFSHTGIYPFKPFCRYELCKYRKDVLRSVEKRRYICSQLWWLYGFIRSKIKSNTFDSGKSIFLMNYASILMRNASSLIKNVVNLYCTFIAQLGSTITEYATNSRWWPIFSKTFLTRSGTFCLDDLHYHTWLFELRSRVSRKKCGRFQADRLVCRLIESSLIFGIQRMAWRDFHQKIPRICICKRQWWFRFPLKMKQTVKWKLATCPKNTKTTIPNSCRVHEQMQKKKERNIKDSIFQKNAIISHRQLTAT